LLELVVTHLVAIFKVPIVIRVLLDSIVRQVHILVVRIVGINTELAARCPQVPFFEYIKATIIVEESPDSYIKLPHEDKERPLNVLLNDKAVVFHLERDGLILHTGLLCHVMLPTLLVWLLIYHDLGLGDVVGYDLWIYHAGHIVVRSLDKVERIVFAFFFIFFDFEHMILFFLHWHFFHQLLRLLLQWVVVSPHFQFRGPHSFIRSLIIAFNF